MVILHCQMCFRKVACIKDGQTKFCSACTIEKCRTEIRKEKEYIYGCPECFYTGRV